MLLSDTIKRVIWEWYSRYFYLFLALSKIRMLICLGLTAVQHSFDLRQEGGHQEICTIKHWWWDYGIYTRRRQGGRSRHLVFSFSPLLNSSPSLGFVFPTSSSVWSLSASLRLPFSGWAALALTMIQHQSFLPFLWFYGLYFRPSTQKPGSSFVGAEICPGPAHSLTKL